MAKFYNLAGWPAGMDIWKKAAEAADQGATSVRIKTKELNPFQLMMKLYRVRKALLVQLDPEEEINEWIGTLHFLSMRSHPTQHLLRTHKLSEYPVEDRYVEIFTPQHEDVELEVIFDDG